ncbi:hypothetical protein D3C72_1657040 [compost metagenome]
MEEERHVDLRRVVSARRRREHLVIGLPQQIVVVRDMKRAVVAQVALEGEIVPAPAVFVGLLVPGKRGGCHRRRNIRQREPAAFQERAIERNAVNDVQLLRRIDVVDPTDPRLGRHHLAAAVLLQRHTTDLLGRPLAVDVLAPGQLDYPVVPRRHARQRILLAGRLRGLRTTVGGPFLLLQVELWPEEE